MSDRLAQLCFDEMTIEEGDTLDKQTGKSIGHVTLPGHSGKATKVLVFLLAGLKSRWKQIVAYYFTSNRTRGEEISKIIIEIINKCKVIGITVKSVTSDMGSPNLAAWKNLGIKIGNDEKSKCSFECCENKIHVLADVPHLLKNLRNHITNGYKLILHNSIVQKHNLPSIIVSNQYKHL